MSIFKAYDIRGIVGKTLTAEVVEAIGHAIDALMANDIPLAESVIAGDADINSARQRRSGAAPEFKPALRPG